MARRSRHPHCNDVVALAAALHEQASAVLARAAALRERALELRARAAELRARTDALRAVMDALWGRGEAPDEEEKERAGPLH
ncbi:MAG: hypothetical protein QM820_65335 [Minicystis sp.]